jgi:hypothetical protein
VDYGFWHTRIKFLVQWSPPYGLILKQSYPLKFTAHGIYRSNIDGPDQSRTPFLFFFSFFSAANLMYLDYFGHACGISWGAVKPRLPPKRASFVNTLLGVFSLKKNTKLKSNCICHLLTFFFFFYSRGLIFSVPITLFSIFKKKKKKKNKIYPLLVTKFHFFFFFFFFFFFY